MKQNFDAALAFVWGPGRDSPDDGYHVTPGDEGGGTFGGVIETTWAAAAKSGLVTGTLKVASRDALSKILRVQFWGPACDALPAGIDLLLFNGRMMTGHYPKMFQTMIGFFGEDVDGDIGPVTVKAVTKAQPEALAYRLTGAHLSYLADLTGWALFGKGWETRVLAAETAALALLHA